MAIPASFCWKAPGKEHFYGRGITRDMSVASVFIFTSTCPPVEATVETEVFVPSSRGAPRSGMKASLKVVRVEHDIVDAKRSGFSAVGSVFEVRKVPEPLAGQFEDVEKAVEARKK